MSADRSQRVFDATPARKAKAKREGNVPRSTEASAIAAFAAGTAATFATLPMLGAATADAVRSLADRPSLDNVVPSIWRLGAFALVPLCAAAAGGAGLQLAQGGGLRLTALKLQFSRLHPGAGVKRMAGAQAWVGAARAILAFGLTSCALIPFCRDVFARATALSDPAALGELVADGAQRACWSAIAVGVCFALADYAVVRRTWLRDLKMTHDEIRRDHKENDGDPHTRSRRKTLHRTLVRGAVSCTREASFVVVNPTHIAIAVRYAPPEVPVPEILVRAADEAAASVKELAARYAIPIVENVALARALYARGEAGRAIPAETFVAVARTIAELIRAGALA